MFYGAIRSHIVVLVFAMGMGWQAVWAQDAAWDGLITSGRAALQQDRLAEAERLFEQALETAEQFPPGDPRLGRSLNNLSAVYYKQKDYDRAEPLMRRSLNVLEEALGPDNADVAQTKKNLAAIYYLQGNFEDAEPLLKQALAAFEDLHGPSHAFVATVLNNLAALYQSQRRFAEAERLLTRSLDIWESLLGQDHRDVVRSRQLLTELRRANGLGPSEPGNVQTANLDNSAEATSPARPVVQPAAKPIEQPAEQPDVDRGSAEQFLALANEAEAAVAKDVADELERARDAALSPSSGADDDGESNEALQSLAALSTEDVEAAGGSEPGALPAPSVQPATPQSAAGPSSSDPPRFAVYLSTLWSEVEAQRYWNALKSEMPDILADKEMELEEITVAEGGGTFFRVLTSPFSTDPDAQAACDQIRSQIRTHDCSVVALAR